MALLDDIIAQQRSQYPYFLPETDRPPASQNVLEMPPMQPLQVQPPTPTIIDWRDPNAPSVMDQPRSPLFRPQPTIPGPAQEALVSGQILESAPVRGVQRALGLPGELIARAALPGTTQLLGPKYGPAAAMVLGAVLPAVLFGRAGMGEMPAATAEGIPRMVEPEVMPGPTSSAVNPAPFQTGGIFPGEPTTPLVEQGTARLPPATGPLSELPTRQGTTVFPAATMEHTAPLPELEQRGQFYHGTPAPIVQLVPHELVSSPANLAGPGVYSAENAYVAQGTYASAGSVRNKILRSGERIIEDGKGHTYAVWDIREVPYLNGSRDPIPSDVLAAVKRRVPQFKAEQYEGVPGMTVYRAHVVRSPENLAIKQALTEELQKRGYRGLRYMDWVGTGLSDPYEVKVNFDAEDIRMREINLQGRPRPPAPVYTQGAPYSALPNPRPIIPQQLQLPPPTPVEPPAPVAAYRSPSLGGWLPPHLRKR